MTGKNDFARAFWICAAVTALSAIVSASFSLAALLGPGQNDVYAMYAASRSISLPLVILALIYFRSRAGMAAMALTMGLVQFLDALVGLLSHDSFKTYGPLVLALITFASLAWLLRSSQGA
ncbi:MAG TPA: hypothetical protein VGX78_09140 [Pirellulales bacterium]|jgi:hypothetical protein|nr:hypothetical protein [Pirellulales bacterium]